MIFLRAVQEFRNRQLRNLSRLKRLPERELTAELRARGARWVTEPREYQKVALLAALKLRTLYLDMDPGVGKTKVAIDTFLSRRRKGWRVLVLVPATVNVETWREQVQTHAPKLTFIGLDEGTRAQKIEAIEDPDSTVVCTTYAGWLALTHTRGHVNRKGRGCIKRDDSYHDKLARLFDMVVLDEATAFKSHMSKTFRSLRRLRRLVDYILALSGTPMDKDPSDLWSQFYVLDGGETLGETLGLFRESFFAKKEDYWGNVEWEFENKRSKELRKRLRNRAIQYRDYECLDLPPLTGGMLSEKFMVCSVPWPHENWTYYERLLDDMRKAAGNPDMIENTYLRMRQVCSGFLPVDDPDTGQREIIYFKHNPKLEALMQKLSEIPQELQVLVYCESKHGGALIEKRLQQERIKHLRLYSGTKDKSGTIRRFKTDPKIHVLLASRAVAFGSNLQVANHGILYESPDSVIAREQVERRLYRQGQTRHTYLWDLAVKNSVDLRILKSLRSGKDLVEELRSGRDTIRDTISTGS